MKLFSFNALRIPQDSRGEKSGFETPLSHTMPPGLTASLRDAILLIASRQVKREKPPKLAPSGLKY